MSTEPCVCGHDYMDHDEEGECHGPACKCKAFISLDVLAQEEIPPETYQRHTPRP